MACNVYPIHNQPPYMSNKTYILNLTEPMLSAIHTIQFTSNSDLSQIFPYSTDSNCYFMLGEGNIYSTLALDPLLVAWIFKRLWKFSTCKRSSIMQSVKAFLLFLYRLSETICGPSLFWCKSRRKVLDVSVVVGTFFHPIDNTRSFQQT